MTTLTFRGDQIGEALQFQTNGTTTTVEVGRVWFAATDVVTMTLAPGAIGATGSIIGGPGAITALSVTTASGQVTSFFPSPDGLDIDPDQEKNGADFFHISESPDAGVGGAYAGLQLEKLLISDTPLIAGAQTSFGNLGGYVGAAGPVTPAPRLIGDALDNSLTGTAAADRMEGRAGNDTILSQAGNDTVLGGTGNDRIDAGAGNDRVVGGDGNDLILGGAGADRLTGEAGYDVFDGGTGRDTMSGGLGGDTFVFGTGDRVTDFNALEGDQIAFDAGLGLDLADITITIGTTGTTIGHAGGSLFLAGVTQPFDTGNAFDFGYQPGFEFV
jgi:Ca2+-binding RTX toxin-like protein